MKTLSLHSLISLGNVSSNNIRKGLDCVFKCGDSHSSRGHQLTGFFGICTQASNFEFSSKDQLL